MSPHTILHALRPHLCGHRMAEIHNCVMCERRLHPERQHVDTCGDRCFNRLRRIQERNNDCHDTRLPG